MNRPKRYSISRGAHLVALVLLGAIAPLVSMSGDAQSQPGDTPAAELRLVTDDLMEPVYVTSAGDGSGRLFVVEKAGTIRIIQDGELLAAPFLEISNRVDTSGLERGMLGLEFHPDYASNGRLYVTHVPDDGAWSLEQYTVSMDPNRVDPASVTELIYHAKEDHYAGHYGGMLLFGPDGYLYASIGDGGGEFDPFSHAQNLETLPGSILRLDVDGGEPYGIPDDNPFVGVDEARPEIWLYGLRNPWRFSFDRVTGDLYIGDVGHVDFEEINYLPAGSAAGINYGWPEVEGPDCSIAAPDCDPSLFEPPIHAYAHLDGCTIVGGYVDRQQPVSAGLYGRYIFGDYCDGTIWSLQRSDGGDWERETLLETDFNISSFGEDAAGRLYVTDITGGGVYEIVDPNRVNGPVLDRLGQPNIVAGGGSCSLDIIGSGFRQGALVLWDGAERETNWIHSGRLAITIGETDLGQPGPVQISVRNPDPNPDLSNAVPLDIMTDVIPDNALTGDWQRLDQPVRAGEAGRSWAWGPEPLTCPMLEPYDDSPHGVRAVQYFPKGRLEIAAIDGEPEAEPQVSYGLLALEMIAGQVQTGSAVEERTPTEINVAGDADDPNSPTYAAFGQRLDEAPQQADIVLTRTIDGSGAVTDNPNLANYEVQAVVIDSVTNHAIAQPFWELMNLSGTIWDGQNYTDAQLFETPYTIAGRPITEAYWANILVAGQQRDVLIQCFERRCLTYTPDNPPGWQVETGNAGRHYYDWRYGGV